MEPDHTVLDRHPMQEGLLVVQEVGVGEPELISHAVVEGQIECHFCIRQSLVPPALLEIHSDGVVLGRGDRKNKNPILKHFTSWIRATKKKKKNTK